jgi:DNA-binding NarL/FixJ family response regulator
MNHVIVVEDDPHNAILFRKILEKRAGCNVTLTEDPAEVLDLVRGGDVALVILDVSLRHSQWQGRPAGGAPSRRASSPILARSRAKAAARVEVRCGSVRGAAPASR